MVTYRKADISGEQQSEYLKGLPSIPPEWTKKEEDLNPIDADRVRQEKLMMGTYMSGGYTTPASIPERMIKPPTPKKLTMFREWEQDIRKQPIERRKKQLKLLFIQYMNKYATNPYKYIAHPKQIKNLPSWFEDAMILFKDDEISSDEKKGIRAFFHDLIRWRDSQVGTSDEKVDEQNRQYGLEQSPYQPEGLTPEEVDTIVSTGEIKNLDVEALKKGMMVGRDAASEADTGGMGAPSVRGEEIATPEFGGGASPFEEEAPAPQEGAPEVVSMGQTRAPSPFPETREEYMQPTLTVPEPKRLAPVFVPPPMQPTSTVTPTSRARPSNLAKIITGGGLSIGSAPTARASNLEKYMIGGKKVKVVAHKAKGKKVRPGKKAQMRASVMGGLGRIDMGISLPHIDTGMSVIGGAPRWDPPFSLQARRNRPKMPTMRAVDGKDFWKVKMHGLTGNITGSEQKTSDMVTNLIGGTKKSLNISIVPEYTRRAAADMKKVTSSAVISMPKMAKPIKRGEGNIKERDMLGATISGMKGIIGVGPNVRGSDFSIPDMSPVKYNFGLVRKNQLSFMKKKSKEPIDEYVDYVEEE